MELDDRVVGLNFVAPEDHPVSLRDYSRHMNFIKELSQKFEGSNRNIALHAGELSLGPERVPRHEERCFDLTLQTFERAL